MKRVLILHGTDGSPDANWFPWLKEQLELRGFEIWVPELPNNHTPDRRVYNDFLLAAGWDLADNLIIGHSSGAVSILNLLEDNRCPRIKAGVLVGAWAHMDETDLDREQFKGLFPEEGFDFTSIASKAGKLIYIHGDEDPYCPLEQAQWLAEQTKSEITVIPGGHHLGSRYTELPEILKVLENHKLI